MLKLKLFKMHSKREDSSGGVEIPIKTAQMRGRKVIFCLNKSMKATKNHFY